MKILFFLVSVILGGICGLLAAWTGQGGPKPARRILVPAITTLFSVLACWNGLLVLLMARSGVLSQGYGISADDPKPSAVGAFWFKVLKSYQKASIATRATMGFQECIILALIPWTTGHWFWYFPACVSIIWNWVYFGAIKNNEGTFKLFGKEFLWEEVKIHGINSFVIALLSVFSA